MTVKRSSREGRWADLPSARVRFGIEAAFLLIVAAGAALANLSPAQVIMLMFVAWLLVALIERASAAPQSRLQAAESGSGDRRWSWRRRREKPEAVDPTAAPDEHHAPTHVREPEPEPEPEPGGAEDEVTAAADEAPAPAVTKRALDLSGLEEPEAAPPPETQPGPEPEPGPVAVEPPPPPPAERPALSPAPREWNLWDLERQARVHAGESARDEEWTALFVHLRQFASTDGLLPKEFDGLVRESFAELIQTA